MLEDLQNRTTTFLRGKTVLVTGAAGSIGTALVDRLLQLGVDTVRLLDHNEEKSFYLDLKFRADPRVRVLIGDIRDRPRMTRAVHGVQVIFHLAALKHVGLGEYNPFEVVRTNLLALQELIECAIDGNVEKFVFTSSDKAVNPTNVMGGSKFIGERLVTAAHTYRGQAQTVFVSTRFGNVLGTAGSVVPVFARQIAAGGPLTLTDRLMTRFFMTMDESVDLVLAALVASLGGEVFVPKMHAVRLIDLAEALIELLDRERKVAIKDIGLRPGEKYYEELISEHELRRCLETDRLLIVLPSLEEAPLEIHGQDIRAMGPTNYPEPTRWAKQTYSSHSATPLPRPAVVEMLRGAVETLRARGAL